mmetsp:Transcript_41911/g.82782  ORF Transcript_41911/g.82782 Transcript_41911/m.82782 type:complete len:131 (-) Transcript_41911:2370-2762(-)
MRRLAGRSLFSSLSLSLSLARSLARSLTERKLGSRGENSEERLLREGVGGRKERRGENEDDEGKSDKSTGESMTPSCRKLSIFQSRIVYSMHDRVLVDGMNPFFPFLFLICLRFAHHSFLSCPRPHNLSY